HAAIHPAAPLPPRPPPLGQAVRWIARLGGFLARRGDGEPGVKVLWRGLRRLEDLTLGWHLATTPTRLVGNG
ncbi:MAG: IS4 family transposase, partial [Thermomicrobiales bacterium]